MDVDKFFVIAVIAAFCLGPHRLIEYTKHLGGFIRRLRQWADSAKTHVEQESGVDIDWVALDPRRYDPRRIIRDALTSEPAPLREVDPVVDSPVKRSV